FSNTKNQINRLNIHFCYHHWHKGHTHHIKIQQCTKSVLKQEIHRTQGNIIRTKSIQISNQHLLGDPIELETQWKSANNMLEKWKLMTNMQSKLAHILKQYENNKTKRQSIKVHYCMRTIYKEQFRTKSKTQVKIQDQHEPS
ncbi:hypothetical protein ACJX0J_010526, partial [Zea mays]